MHVFGISNDFTNSWLPKYEVSDSSQVNSLYRDGAGHAKKVTKSFINYLRQFKPLI